MKMKPLFLAAFLTFSVGAFSQEATTVIEKTASVGSENGIVLSVKINRASEKDILKEWKSKMKDFNGDAKTKKEVVTATSVKIESIDSNPIEVIAEVRKSTEQEFELVVMFVKNGAPLSSTSDLSGFTAAKSIVRNFANEISKEATEDYQKEQVKMLDKATKEYESAVKDTEKAQKAIEDAKAKIEEAKKTIKEAEAKIKEKTKFVGDNKKSQADLSKKIEEQKKVVKTANNEVELFK